MQLPQELLGAQDLHVLGAEHAIKVLQVAQVGNVAGARPKLQPPAVEQHVPAACCLLVGARFGALIPRLLRRYACGVRCEALLQPESRSQQQQYSQEGVWYGLDYGSSTKQSAMLTPKAVELKRKPGSRRTKV